MKTKNIFKTKDDILMFVHWIVILKLQLIPKSTKKLETQNGCCCLGTACYLTIPTKNLLINNVNDLLLGCYPDKQVHAPDWLKDINNDFNKRHPERNLLSRLNDYGYSHPKIANILIEMYKKELGAFYYELKKCFKIK